MLERTRPVECGAGCGGWVWNEQTHVTTIRLTQAVPVSEKVAISLEGAGTFADAEILQKVLGYRGRIRSVKEVEKLKWAVSGNWYAYRDQIDTQTCAT